MTCMLRIFAIFHLFIAFFVDFFLVFLFNVFLEVPSFLITKVLNLLTFDHIIH